MTAKIRLRIGQLSIEASLNDSTTAAAILEALPFRGEAQRWGEEIYFSIPVALGEAPDARQEMTIGELAFWPAGHAFCIFFGPTPVSTGHAPRAYSNVNPFGRIEGETDMLKSVQDGEQILVERVLEPPGE